MKKIKITFLILLAFILIGSGSYICWCYNLQDDVIWSNYVVNGVEIKGLTITEAAEAIQAKFEQDYQDCHYKVTIAHQTYDLDVFPALSLDATEIIQSAYSIGHREWFKTGMDYYLNSKVGDESVEIEIVPEIIDSDSVINQLSDTNIERINTVEESVVLLQEDRISIHKGHNGEQLDKEALISLIEDSLEQGILNLEIECPTKDVMMKDINLETYYQQIHKLKVNAILDPRNTTEVLPSEIGVSFDLEAALAEYDNAAEDSDVEIMFEYDAPDITTEEMQALIFRDRLSYVEVKGGGSSNRMANIDLACNFCNETIIAPGEVFSYNETVGQRTSERGFKVAGVYSNGTVAQGIGGGICQVSSTIYDTALYANLEIIERRNHSLTVSYLPLGMDAMVDWGTQDFKFKNNTKFPVKLQIVYENGIVKSSLWGTKLDDYSVEIINESTGGLSCDTYRKVYDTDGNLISEEMVAKSRYMGGH